MQAKAKASCSGSSSFCEAQAEAKAKAECGGEWQGMGQMPGSLAPLHVVGNPSSGLLIFLYQDRCPSKNCLRPLFHALPGGGGGGGCMGPDCGGGGGGGGGDCHAKAKVRGQPQFVNTLCALPASISMSLPDSRCLMQAKAKASCSGSPSWCDAQAEAKAKAECEGESGSLAPLHFGWKACRRAKMPAAAIPPTLGIPRDSALAGPQALLAAPSRSHALPGGGGGGGGCMGPDCGGGGGGGGDCHAKAKVRLPASSSVAFRALLQTV